MKRFLIVLNVLLALSIDLHAQDGSAISPVKRRVIMVANNIDGEPNADLELLGPQAFPEILELIPEYLASNHPRMRALVAILAHATSVFGASDPAIRESGLQKLESLLSSANAEARAGASVCLADVGGAAYIAKLVPLLQDTVERVRIDTAKSLGRNGTVETISVLESAITARKAGKSPEQIVRDYSIRHMEAAIAEIRRRSAGARPAKPEANRTDAERRIPSLSAEAQPLRKPASGNTVPSASTGLAEPVAPDSIAESTARVASTSRSIWFTVGIFFFAAVVLILLKRRT